ncbi:Pentatricopeptide repeat-containing protein, partial [Dichanthelium oligosanthes]
LTSQDHSAQGARFPDPATGMLKTSSVRLLRDGGFRRLSQGLPSGYSETIVPLIRRFCSTTVESLTYSKGDGEASNQDAADQPRDNSACGSEPSHGISEVRKQVKSHGPKKKHEPSKRGRRGKKVPGRDGPTQDGHHHEMKWPGRDGPSHKGSRHGNELAVTPFKPFLFQTVLDTPISALMTVLDTWVEVGNRLERNEVVMVLFHLRKQKLYSKALKFMDWIERSKLLDFEEHDYVCHLDLIARNHGVEAAQKYIKMVPIPFRNEVLYETLLVNCVCQDDIQKAQQVFTEIRVLSLPLTVSACNQMILLYKRVARNKVVDILTLMEKENIKPNRFTYKLLIDLKGRSNDTLGMELVLNAMKDNGLEPDFATQTMIAKFYISGGLTEKAEEVIRAMELHVKDSRDAIRSVLGLYAILGRPDDVERIWNLCTEPKLDDLLAAIEAWGKLGRIEQVEEAFEALVKISPKPTSKYINAMVNVYAENKLLAKGKKFLERMCLDGCPSNPRIWDAIVSLYVNSGELAKADSFLVNLTEENPDRYPLFHSYATLLKAYAEKGDIHNSEKIFHSIKQIRYPGRTPPYNLLLAAYASARVTPHGFRERMQADNVRPRKTDIECLNRLNDLQKIEC